MIDYSYLTKKQHGKIILFLMKGHEEIYQTVELPRFVSEQNLEVFGKWTPTFKTMSNEFLTDSNAFNLKKRKVFTGEESFAKSFYPVDSSITISGENGQGETSLTVWNDRPQAGSVHSDSSIKLLIDRRVRS